MAVALLEGAEMRGKMLELELVAGGRAYGGVAVGEPLESDEGEPAVGLGEVVSVGFAPVVEVGSLGVSGDEGGEQERESEGGGSEGHVVSVRQVVLRDGGSCLWRLEWAEAGRRRLVEGCFDCVR